MGKAHVQFPKEDRIKAFEEHRQELQGRLPKGNFEFEDPQVESTDTASSARFKRAVLRDAKYSSAGPVYLRLFGMSQHFRSVYDGGKQIWEGDQKK